MSSQIFPLRWKSTGDQWWFASPIDWAAANGHYDLVRELLHLDTNLLIKLTSLRRIRRLETVWDDEDQFKIVAKCRASVAKKLLQECETKGQGPFTGSNSLIRAGYGGWLLYTAASSGDVEFVKELLKRDPLLVFGEGEYGVTDIFYGAGRGKDLEVFRVILDCALFLGGEMEGKGVKGEVSEEFRWEIMNRGVHGAAKGGNVEFLKEILEDCDDVLVYRDANGSSILHTASGKGQSEVIKYLLASYDNIIDSTDIHGNTALHVAAYRGHLPVVEILITASPSLALLTNLFGDTFLHMAVSGFQSPGFRRLDHQIKLMKQLLSGTLVDLSEIVNIRNNDGRTALHLAMTGNVESELVELLMTAPLVRINLNTRDSDGKTALDLLKQRPRTASSEFLIKRLISAGGISNSQDRLTRTALVSHLKTQTKGILGSPGASFGIPDAEMFLYAGVNNESDGSCDFATEYTSCSGLESESGSKSEKGLKTLLQRALGENDSGESKVEYNPIPLRQRFSNVTSFQNNKRVSAQTSLPSPSTKKKYTAGLMHGVIQLMPRSSFGSPKSPFSGSSWASPISKEKRAFSS